MDLLLVLSFLGVAIMLTLMPGPDILFVIAQSISQNKKAGIVTALGLCTGLLLHITAAVAGLSALIYQSALVFSIVKYAGAAYLLYLAFRAFRSHQDNVSFSEQKSANYKSLYKKGIIMNVLNPKVSLFFLALLPQFVNQHSGYVAGQMFVLGFVFLVQAFVIFSCVSLFSDKVGDWIRRHQPLSRRIHLIEGVLLTLIGIQVAFSGK